MLRTLLVILITATLIACTQRPEAIVDGEKLRGEYLADSGVTVFRGIPFADPPVGDLRWRAPQPLKTTVAVRDVTEFAPACMQSMRILEWYRDMAEIFGSTRDEFEDLETSEDCLYLNVWTTNRNENAKLPVMVYVHGGSNNSGWSYEPDYHGHVLAERGVVVVSIAYRLGLFGFLSHPDIEDAEVQANFGLWDQVSALQWIQQNIQQFGGDPDRITLFGESAGSQDILALMTSPKAKGLFHRAILQSNAGFGLPPRTRTVDGERQRGEETSRLFGFEGKGAWQQLKAIPADELLARYEEHFPRYYHAPAVDGQLLPSPIWDTITAGQLADIPFIIGSNGDERYGGTPEDATEETVRRAIEETAHLNSAQSFAAVQSETDYREMIDRISTADGMLCPSQYTAALYDDAWVYYFARVREGDGGAAVRAYHGAELPYTFGTHPTWMTTTDVDRKLTDQIISYWTQFAATGNPNSSRLPEWPAFTGPDDAVMEFAEQARSGAPQEPVLCRIFRESVAALK